VVEPTHNRQEKWDGQPFGSVEEVVGLQEELVALVQDAAPGEGVELQMVSIDYGDKSYPLMPLGDFRDLSPALELEGATFNLNAETAGHPKPVAVIFTLNKGADEPWANLTVVGNNEVAINGVFAAVKERVDALYERKRHAEELAATAAEAPTTLQVVMPMDESSRLRRFAYNPYVLIVASALVGFALGKVF
jgi:hypothetical protein